MNLTNFFAELKRRNVYKVAVAYIVAGWALSQGIAQVFPVFDVPNWAIRTIVLLIILGFPVAVVFAWFFEITPEGIKRTEVADAARQHSRGKAWIYVVVIGAIVSIGLFLLGRYSAATYDAASARTEPAAIPAKSIAVLPFENLSDDKNTAYFSDGITEEILNALAQIPNLKVAARRSAFQFKGNDLDLHKIGQVLGVAHILEGSLQKAGDQVRINVQLVDVQNGLQAWSEKYDRKLDNVFAVEDEIAKAIATKLRVQLTGGAGQPLVVDSTNNPRAHELYLRGLTLLAARGPGLREASDLFQQTVKTRRQLRAGVGRVGHNRAPSSVLWTRLVRRFARARRVGRATRSFTRLQHRVGLRRCRAREHVSLSLAGSRPGIPPRPSARTR